MRLWPQKRWKKILLTALLITLAVLVSLFGYLEYTVYREVSSPIETLNVSGQKSALVIYHPSTTDFARNVTYTYAETLAANGWRVDISTVSSESPTDLSNYSLLVLNWAIYDLNPAPTIKNYVSRVGDLKGIDTTVIMISGGLNPFKAQDTMNKIVQDANGNLVQSLELSRGNRNFAALQEAAIDLTP